MSTQYIIHMFCTQESMNTLTEYTPDHITEPPPPPHTYIALFILDKTNDMKNRWGGLKLINMQTGTAHVH